jgi:hypothetical protein
MKRSDDAAPPHIFTLTGNLLAERTLDFERWQPGETQRARRESFQVGGKGINVSKMLNRLGSPNTALCFVGGAPGAECAAWLETRGFSFRTDLDGDAHRDRRPRCEWRASRDNFPRSRRCARRGSVTCLG